MYKKSALTKNLILYKGKKLFWLKKKEEDECVIFFLQKYILNETAAFLFYIKTEILLLPTLYIEFSWFPF